MALVVPAQRVAAQSTIRDSVELEPVVVTASHSPKALKDAPVVTRLITLHDIKITDATNIQDMLTQEIPGLEFGLAMTQETSLNMSGFGGNAVLFLIDGERMAGETMDNIDYSRMNLDNVGRIEIVKGASSALYGSMPSVEWSISSAGSIWNLGPPASTLATIPSGMSGATELPSRSTPEDGTRRPASSTPLSTPSTCPRLIPLRRLPPN